jgi:hypothetical protein
MMLRTAVQVQGAVAATCLDLAGRWFVSATAEAGVVARAVAQPFRTQADQRQNAVEDAVWTLYEAHERMLRSMTGAPAASILVFLNELDVRRGRRNVSNAGHE